MLARLIVRPYRADSDLGAITQLFYDAVRSGTTAHYTSEQRRAWAPSRPDADAWRQRLDGTTSFVAEDDAGIAGFMTLKADGYLDLAFVRPDVARQGVGTALYRYLEAEAARLGLDRLFSDASELARPFLEKQGWVLIAPQSVHCGRVELQNYRMEKALP